MLLLLLLPPPMVRYSPLCNARCISCQDGCLILEKALLKHLTLKVILVYCLGAKVFRRRGKWVEVQKGEGQMAMFTIPVTCVSLWPVITHHEVLYFREEVNAVRLSSGGRKRKLRFHRTAVHHSMNKPAVTNSEKVPYIRERQLACSLIVVA